MFDFMTEELLRKFIKFGLVGFSGVFVDFGFTFLAKEKLKIHKYLSNAIGFVIAASSNYLLNRLWTFESHNPEIGKEYSLFFLFSLIGLGINTLILYLLVEKLNWNFYFSKLFAIGAVTLWNFGINYMITFS